MFHQRQCYLPLFFLAAGSHSEGMGKDSSSMGPHSVDTSTTVSIITSSAGVNRVTFTLERHVDSRCSNQISTPVWWHQTVTLKEQNPQLKRHWRHNFLGLFFLFFFLNNVTQQLKGMLYFAQFIFKPDDPNNLQRKPYWAHSIANTQLWSHCTTFWCQTGSPWEWASALTFQLN